MSDTKLDHNHELEIWDKPAAVAVVTYIVTHQQAHHLELRVPEDVNDTARDVRHLHSNLICVVEVHVEHDADVPPFDAYIVVALAFRSHELQIEELPFQ